MGISVLRISAQKGLGLYLEFCQVQENREKLGPVSSTEIDLRREIKV